MSESSSFPPVESLARRVTSGAALSLAGDVAAKGLTFAVTVFVARRVGSSAFGVFSIGLAVFTTFELIGRLGLTDTSVRFVAAYRARGERSALRGLLSAAPAAAFFTGLAAAALLWAGASVLASVFGEPQLAPVLRAFAPALPFTVAAMVAADATKGFGTVRHYVAARQVAYPLVLLIGVVAVALVLDGGVARLPWAWTAAGVAGLAWLMPALHSLAPDPAAGRRLEVGPVARFALPMLGVGVAHVLFQRADVYLLGLLATSAEVGRYAAAFQVALLAGLVLAAFTSLFAPFLSGLHAVEDRVEARGLYATVSRLVLLATVPAVVAMVGAPEPLLALYGEGFVGGEAALAVLAGAHLFTVVPGPVSAGLTMTGRPGVELANALGGLVLNVILNLALIPPFGVLGAALATGFSLVALHALRTVALARLEGLDAWDGRYALAGGLAVAGGAVVVIGTRTLLEPTTSLVRVAGVGFAGAAVSLGVVEGLGLEPERRLLRLAARRLVAPLTRSAAAGGGR